MLLKELGHTVSTSILLPPQGSLDQDRCQSLHSINPYSRIIFNMWNLDHRLETLAESEGISVLGSAGQAYSGKKKCDVLVFYMNWS